jgi:cellulose synthase/poly-beta-1,6-N-acetylglucosamine synthase-like glycosyltransferase
METVFIVLGVILFLQSLLALGAALRFSRYSLRHARPRAGRYQPKSVVIVPCKGLEHDFEENIRALFAQEYRDYEIIFVTESEADPAYGVLSRLIKNYSRRPAWLVVAGEANDRGQKVHNLLAAVDMLNSIDRRAEVIVFADTDARPTKYWLAELVAPLGDKRIGATTGFRWYLPMNGAFGSLLLSVWNSSALSLLGERSSFAWGGSTAIRREAFDRLGIKQRWQGALSDDYALSGAVHEAGQRIKFVSHCLVASHAEANLADLLEFSTRQMRITRVYAPRLWKVAAVSHCLYNLTFWGGLIWLVAAAFAGKLSVLPAALLTGIFLLGATTGWTRAVVAAHLLPANRSQIQRHWWGYVLLGPLISLLYVYNVFASAWTKRIVWRGIGYEMISPRETTIWHRLPQRPNPDTTARPRRQRKASVRSSSSKP